MKSDRPKSVAFKGESAFGDLKRKFYRDKKKDDNNIKERQQTVKESRKRIMWHDSKQYLLEIIYLRLHVPMHQTM